MAKKKTPSDGPSLVDPALVAILAAVLWPEDFRNGRTPEAKAEAIRRAHKLIGSVPDYLGGKNPSLKESFQHLESEMPQRMEEAREWGFADPWSHELYQKTKNLPDGVLTFDRAIAKGICIHHKTPQGLEKFLRTVGYPESPLRSRGITEFGYMRALEKQESRQRKADRDRKKEKRSQNAGVKSALKPT
jgi:hypothetical protein